MAMPPRTDGYMQAGLNLIQQALSIYDRELRLQVCNRPFQRMFALPQALVQPGATFAETIRYLVEAGEYGDVGDQEAFVAARVAQAEAFQPHYMERQRANGRVISVEGSPLPQGGWVTVYTDITDVKRQEQLLRSRSEELSDQLLTRAEELAQSNRHLEATIAQLEQAKSELTEMEARSRLVTEMAPAHIAHVDATGIYTFTNGRLPALLPNRPGDIVGLTLTEALGPAAASRLGPSLAQAQGGTPAVLEFTEPVSGRRIRTAFTPDEKGAGGVYILSTDVTEEAQARAALEQTHKRELATQLTSGLAHDFANLLTIILGLQSRLERLDLPVGARELTDATKAAARRGGLLLDKIADMSGRRTPQIARVSIPQFMAQLTTLARAALPSDIRLSTGADIPHSALMLDAGSLQDGILNLVLNARDAIGTAPGEIAITLTDVQNTWLEIRVEDTGPGFSDAALAQGLEPFFSTKGGQGSGLGLTMVFDLVKLSGGRMTLANSDRGGCVTLRLPLKPAQTHPDPRLILLIDDMIEVRAAVRDTLTGLGHQVIEASNGQEALALTGLPGLSWVISDIRLGAEDGVALLEDVAKRQGHLALALMTSLPPGDARRMRGERRWPVLSKPIARDALAALFHTEAAP